MRLVLHYIGKARDVHANAIAGEFIKRASRYMPCEMREINPDRFDLPREYPRARKVFLDPAGKSVDSAAFAGLVQRAELDARDLIFLVGGHDGLPTSWKGSADLLLSLTPLTLPHELARAMLAEQIYRALATLRGHPYPR